MDKESFENRIIEQVEIYIENFTIFGKNSQIRINPALEEIMLVSNDVMMRDIAESEETIEDAAAAHGLESQDASEYQVTQNPDYYPVASLLHEVNGKVLPDKRAIGRIVKKYVN